MKRKLLPPSYFNLFILLAIVLHFILPIRRIVLPPYTNLGWPLITLGVALNLWSVRHLRKRNTTADFYGTPGALVTDGPFRISRNPIYLSGVILLFGVALLLGSVITFAFPLALILILDRLHIPAEETELEERFGTTYVEYKQKVRRWI